MIQNKLGLFKHDIISKGGILISENEIISVLRIQNKWFKLNPEIDRNLVLIKIFGNRLFEHFKIYIANSLKIIDQAKEYKDCEKFNNPITLEIQMPAANNA